MAKSLWANSTCDRIDENCCTVFEISWYRDMISHAIDTLKSLGSLFNLNMCQAVYVINGLSPIIFEYYC